MKDHAPCDKCRRMTHIDMLDSKPPMTLKLRAIKALFGQIEMLIHAGDRGHDFTVLECQACYGPGWCPL